MKKLALLVFFVALGLGSAWAAPIATEDFAIGTMYLATTAPGDYTDAVNWCSQFGCLNNVAPFPTPQTWTSTGGVTGFVGLVNTLQPFYNMQQGVTWIGNFNPGEGLVWNGVLFGNTPTGIAATFDSPVYGVGAYIQTDELFTSFNGTITLFDANYQVIGKTTLAGYSNQDPGSALFISLSSTSQDVWAVQFDATPEPGTLVLFGTSALGLAGVLRRRFKGVL